MLNTVKIAYDRTILVSIDDLVPFQGNLKDLSNENYEKLKQGILRLGFSEPFGVWESDGIYYILAGHQRLRTLLAMRDEGFQIPLVPANVIQAVDIAEAKEKILALTSQYGEITRDGLYEFATEAEMTADQIEKSFRFPEINMSTFKREYFEPIPEIEIVEKELDEKIETKNECPSCAYKW